MCTHHPQVSSRYTAFTRACSRSRDVTRMCGSALQLLVHGTPTHVCVRMMFTDAQQQGQHATTQVCVRNNSNKRARNAYSPTTAPDQRRQRPQDRCRFADGWSCAHSSSRSAVATRPSRVRAAEADMSRVCAALQLVHGTPHMFACPWWCRRPSERGQRGTSERDISLSPRACRPACRPCAHAHEHLG